MMTTNETLGRIGDTLAESFPGMPAYVVGGTVRDMLAGRPTADMDLAVGGEVRPVAEELSVELDGTLFLMDPERDVWRITVKDAEPVQVDISPLKGGILDDLAGRDFTMNAMAVELGALGEHGGWLGGIIDPYGGQKDIRAGVIRALGRGAFEEDQLRLIRAFRFAGQLGLEIEAETLALIRELAPAVGRASAERVRDELYMILESAGSAGVFRDMDAAGLLGAVLPEAGAMSGVAQEEPHVHDVMGHSLAAMGYAETVMDAPGRWFAGREDEVTAYLSQRVDGGLTMRGLVKLCSFLHDSGKPSRMAEDEGHVRFIGHDEEGAGINAALAARLRMSERAARALAATARGHMRPLHMTRGVPSRRAVYRYVRDMGDDLPASLIVALADAMATRERPDFMATDVEGLVREVAEYYYGEYMKVREAPLVTGRDLIDVFGLVPGPAFREILDEVEEKRAEGALKDRADALKHIREKIS